LRANLAASRYGHPAILARTVFFKGQPMKIVMTGALAAALMSAAMPAMAQTAAQDQGAKAGATTGVVTGVVAGAIVGGPIGAVIGGVIGASAGGAVGSLTADDRVYVQHYVYQRPVQPVMLQEGVRVGEPLPGNVATYRFEGNQRLATYRYAYVNQQYILIDSNGRVLGAIEK
jgi:hypothetical protein